MPCDCVQAYHAVAAALAQYGTARSTTSDVLRMLPPSTTELHRNLVHKLIEDYGVYPSILQRQTDSTRSPTSSLEGGVL